MLRPSISRSSSLSSTSSLFIADADTESTVKSISKRTRKRFSHNQLIVLEQAYHKTSHPTREEREAVATQTGMDVKSVTIWFQNKRQTDRKVAMGNATNRSGAPVPLTMYHVYHPSTANATHHLNRRPPFPSYPSSQSLPSLAIPSKTRLPSRTASGFLSLDHVATRAELPARAPHMPKEFIRHASYAGGDVKPDSPSAVWEEMPSSPLQPAADADSIRQPGSPSAREYLDFTSTRRGNSRPRGRRTLEWACAAARMTTDKKSTLSPLVSAFDQDSTMALSDLDTEVESDSHEAITPDTSQTMTSYIPSPARTLPISKKAKSAKSKPDKLAMKNTRSNADLMDAAWALCGLSGRRE